MKKKTGPKKPENMGSFIELFKNVKFIVINVLVLAVLALALLSGEGKNIALKFYENSTGQRYETFSPVDDRSTAAYFILKDKLRRDLNLGIEDIEVREFKKSPDFHKYRVAANGAVFFYSVEKNADGVWHIQQLKK